MHGEEDFDMSLHVWFVRISLSLSPSPVIQELTSSQWVSSCAVVAVDPQELGNLCHAPSPALLAVVVPSVSGMSPGLLRTRLLTDVSLPTYGVPDRFVLVDELPVSAHGELIFNFSM